LDQGIRCMQGKQQGGYRHPASVTRSSSGAKTGDLLPSVHVLFAQPSWQCYEFVTFWSVSRDGHSLR
jgi:hypothetical protein